MLRLTRTAIGLLTAQYRSVLRKCWAINVGIFALGAMATTILPSDAYAQYTGGGGNTASGKYSSAFGYSNTASGMESSAFGSYSKARKDYSYAFGYNNEASERYSSAFGFVNIASGVSSSAFGKNNTASGVSSSAFGYGNTASGNSSSAFGIGNTASGEMSSAFGQQSNAYGNNSSAFGDESTAYGISSSAVGNANTAYGMGSSAFGFGAQAGNSSDDTVTNGVTTNSIDRYATAVGSFVQATGLYALALGNQQYGMTRTTASGESAIAIGTGAQAVHDNSVAIGTNSVSAGANTISVGNSTTQRQIKYVAAGTSDTDAVNLKQLNDAIAGVSGGGSSVTLDTTFDAESTNGATSQAIANYLNNNYYRKDEKSGILNGFEEGKIGNEIGDNFSKLAANDNFAITTFLRAI